ncbi:CdaR family protein [uncultured Gemmiger sp.]|uniref:CdaR family protein n=1 Tax=uncultured Gemmiger sp. TaxID=1623490 RepID=UPI0025F7767D|nr:CdaR family protein [uncultured Gemmiger sp.]
MIRKKSNPPEPDQAIKKRSLMDNKLFLLVISLLCAIISWSIVTLTFDPEGDREFTVSEINYSYNSNLYTAMGLDIVDAPQNTSVRVKVEGSGTVIGQLSASDLMVYPNYSTVTGSGEQTLTLQARIANSQFANNASNIVLTVLTPTQVTVVFDRVSEKTLPVTIETSGLRIAEDYMLYRSSAVPAEVTITGPQSELDSIASVVAPVAMDGELSDSTSQTAALELRDEGGNVITPEYTSMDSESANVTLTVYQVRELPLAIDFINTPTNFDTSSLDYTLSQETMLVAGPTRTVSALSELSVISFDLGQQFAFDRDYQLPVELPGGLVALDDTTSVTLSFDTSGMSAVTLNVPNIQTINMPSNYDIEVMTERVPHVTLYGPQDEIAQLSPESVVAQLDCQNLQIAAGQQTLPVTIQIPSSSRVFAVGSYSVLCQITAR